MNTNVIKSLFILSSKLRVKQGQLYQLIQAAESCYCLKDAEGQRELGGILKNFPNPIGAIGDYYEAFYLTRTGQYEESQRNLNRALVSAPESYKAKALIALGGLEERRGNFDEALRFRIEVPKFNNIPFTLESNFGVAALLGMQGDHIQAIKILESLLPNLRLLKGTTLYFDYLNSYAVELGDTGRVNEALDVIQTVVKSPYVPSFQTWRETEHELALKAYKSRSTISFIQKKKDNLLYLSEHERSERHRRSPFEQPRGVTTIADWKKKMVKEPNGNGEESEDMSPQDMAMKIVEMITKNREDEESLRKLMEYAKELFSK
jgi:tetratricopeptide (TPR) repeat protein